MSGFVSYRIEAQGTIADLRAAAAQSRRYAQKGLRRGIKDIAVPRAREFAPHGSTGKYESSMKGAVAGLTGFIVSKDPRAGLFEFGGTRRDVIVPHAAQALSTPQGPRAAVRGPRVYHATHSMRRAAVASAKQIADLTGDAVLEAFALYFPVR